MDAKVIGTHNGNFHADEVLGCFLLKQLPEYKYAVIKRTRNLKELDKCDIVIDVGAVYDHAKRRYDHHQRAFYETLMSVTEEFIPKIKLSSAGLVWAHYGRDIITAMTKKPLSENEMKDVYLHLYDNFIKEIDAKDNGIEASDPPYRYRICTDISTRIAKLNCDSWKPDTDEETQFMKAFELVGKEFKELLDECIYCLLPSKKYVAKALENRFTVDISGEIIVIEKIGVPWAKHLKMLESELCIDPAIIFVVFPDATGGWRVQAVSRDGSFLLRGQVLPSCLGLRDEELAEACGIQDAYFVHISGFIAGARTLEGALSIAKLSLVK